ncbi:MAG: hypothetical protein ACXAC7_07280 [Candidatus Hodarchaeales archaeon]|jgi:predicted enzyme related to lactoylglutathione lyase
MLYEILNYQVLTLQSPLDRWESLVKFYQQLDFDLMFEDPEIHVTELQVNTGFYIRIVATDNFSPPNGFHFTIAVKDVRVLHENFKLKGFTTLSSIEQAPSLEFFFTLTDPNGYQVRFAEYEHGPSEWKESLIKLEKAND